ncbi:MAG: nicotinate-nucleotide adenylyltransferase [Burkholderiales bacterium]
MRSIGILGGTFDPIHYGHLRLAEEGLQHLGCAEVRFIPAAIPPHRDLPSASIEQRIAMVKLATQKHSEFIVDEREARRSGRSFTVDTLKELRAEHMGTALFLLMGGDAFAGLTGWSRWRELFSLCHVIVAERPGFSPAEKAPDELRSELKKRFSEDIESLHKRLNGDIASFAMTPLDISASRIRQMIALEQSPRYLLPDSVLDYIQAHSLYRTLDES